jgi:hypothetical protein
LLIFLNFLIDSREDSDHPIVAFKLSGYLGVGGVDGLEILTLNPSYINQYFDNNLKQILTESGIHLYIY